GVDRRVAGGVELAHELVEEQAPQALGRAGVAGEQGALDHFGQVDQGEHGLVEVGEVATEDVGLLDREALGDVRGHEFGDYGSRLSSAPTDWWAWLARAGAP